VKKEIREDMKQLASSEARVATLEQKLQDKVYPTNPQGDAFVSELIFQIIPRNRGSCHGVHHR